MAPLAVTCVVGVCAVGIIGVRIRGFWPPKVDRFPLLAVARRAWSDAMNAVASFTGACALAATAGVLGGLSIDPGAGTWTRIVNGVGSAAISLFLVYGIAAFVKYLRYRRSGYQHDWWQSTLGNPSGGQVPVVLEWPPSNLGQETTALGMVKCLHRRPGDIFEELWPVKRDTPEGGVRQSLSTCFIVEDGDHEIRWYMDPRNHGHFAEICRHTFSIRHGQPT